MRSTIRIDGVPASMGRHELKALLCKFGPVLSIETCLPDMACSSGIATVEMASLRAARKAVLTLHRSYVDGILFLVFHVPRHANSVQRAKARLGRAPCSSFNSMDALREGGNIDATRLQADSNDNPVRKEPPWGDPWDNTPPVVLCGYRK